MKLVGFLLPFLLTTRSFRPTSPQTPLADQLHTPGTTQKLNNPLGGTRSGGKCPINEARLPKIGGAGTVPMRKSNFLNWQSSRDIEITLVRLLSNPEILVIIPLRMHRGW